MKKYIAILIIIPALCASASAQSFVVDRYVIGSGGGHSESAIYIIDGATDQPVFGESSSGNYIIEAGFWVGADITGDCIYIAGDVNHNGISISLDDVIAMIGMYRGDVDYPYECDCPPHNADFAPTADPNGNCIADELSDVVQVIGAYRGGVLAAGCEDCPGSGTHLRSARDQLQVMPILKSRTKIGKVGTADQR